MPPSNGAVPDYLHCAPLGLGCFEQVGGYKHWAPPGLRAADACEDLASAAVVGGLETIGRPDLEASKATWKRAIGWDDEGLNHPATRSG